jgi:hypothetical protein
MNPEGWVLGWNSSSQTNQNSISQRFLNTTIQSSLAMFSNPAQPKRIDPFPGTQPLRFYTSFQGSNAPGRESQCWKSPGLAVVTTFIIIPMKPCTQASKHYWNKHQLLTIGKQWIFSFLNSFSIPRARETMDEKNQMSECLIE